MGFRFEAWTIRPKELPRLWRHCAGCGQTSAFECSEKFRVNANKKSLDVWLIYRCTDCAATWNFPVLSRCNVASIAASRLEAFHDNDRDAAWLHGFNVVDLRRHSTRIDFSGHMTVERSECKWVRTDEQMLGDTILFSLTWPCAQRVDRIIAGELNISRNELHRLSDSAKLQIHPERRDALRRPPHASQWVCFVGMSLPADA